MSRPDPTWYGNVIRSYVAWLVAVAVALAAAWPLWHYSHNHTGSFAFGAFGWSITVLVAVGVVAGVSLTRAVALPCASGLVTLGVLGLAYVAVLVDVRLAWALLVLAPVAGAAVAAIPAASRATCECICVGIYAGVLVWVMVGVS